MAERLVEIEVQKLPEGGYLATDPVLKGKVEWDGDLDDMRKSRT